MSAEPRNKSNRYVHGQQGTCMRPHSSRVVSAVSECNRLWVLVEDLSEEIEALRQEARKPV